jgi:hypothetical protein
MEIGIRSKRQTEPPVNSGIVAGDTNTIEDGAESVILGGSQNTIKGNGSFSAGTNTLIKKLYSFAAGSMVQIDHNQCFVWGDGSQLTTNTTSNQVIARAKNGFFFYTGPASTQQCYIPPGGNAWTTPCDRRFKENVEEIEYSDVLGKLVNLPVYKFNYIGQESTTITRGPMAQDWHQRFPCGKDERGIETIDLDGVALASIKGLFNRTETQNAVFQQTLNQQLAKIEQLTATLDTQITLIEAQDVIMVGLRAVCATLEAQIIKLQTEIATLL